MISFLPAGWTHLSESIGNETASFMFVFPAGFKTFELSDSMIRVDPKVMQAVVGTKLSGVSQNRDAIVAK
jgi:hypothetical protein